MLVYKVTNRLNNQVYIGQTTLSLNERRYRHEQESLNSYRKTVKFHNALLKYGFDNFLWEVIKECTSQEELDYYEKYYIQYYDSCNKEKGYNLKYGGRSGGIFSEEAKKNLGASTLLKWQNPECARKMKEGLRKGTETVKRKASLNYIESICPTCGIVFRTKNWNKHIYCSLECANKANREFAIQNIKKASLEVHQKYLKRQETLLPAINLWAISHKELIENAKLNNLTFLKELVNYVGLKDTRSLGKLLGVTYKKEILYKLKDIIKCTPTI